MRKTLEAICMMALALMAWVSWAALAGPDRLPGRIPIHFDLAGHTDGWGSPTTLLLFPAVAVAIYLTFTLVSRYPSAFNYPVTVTPENRGRLLAVALDMVLWLKTEMVCLFAWIENSAIQAARHPGEGPGGMVVAIPASVAAILATIAWCFVAMRRAARPVRGAE